MASHRFRFASSSLPAGSPLLWPKETGKAMLGGTGLRKGAIATRQNYPVVQIGRIALKMVKMNRSIAMDEELIELHDREETPNGSR